MAKLDDFLQKKKETTPILDLSRTTTCSSREEFRRLLEKVPDFKIKPEKVGPESIRIRDKGFKFKSGKKDIKNMKEGYLFMNPLPVEMQELKIDDLATVSIDWRMLTMLRPKNKSEENYFSRLVELGKLENKSRTAEKRQFQIDPQIRKSKNKAGVVELRVISCPECGEDFCTGRTCSKFGYDSFARQPEVPKTLQKVVSPDTGEKGKKKIKRKSRTKSKSRRKGTTGKSKSKSPKKKSPTKKDK